MSEITIPYHLVIPSFLSAFFLVLIGIKRERLFGNNPRKWMWISLTVFLVFYFVVVGSGAFANLYYQYDVNRYDLNKDGFFGENEITPEQKKAMIRLTNDVGRNFSGIIALIFGFVLAFSTYLIGQVIEAIKSKGH